MLDADPLRTCPLITADVGPVTDNAGHACHLLFCRPKFCTNGL
jgi:hypothetical protein